jgi:Flp pilus assembly pilin Flp
MSEFISTSQDAVRDACIATFVHSHSFMRSVAERAKNDQGQTAAEYMGVLLLIAVIITAVVNSHVGDVIGREIKAKVTEISKIKPD